jgi:hypothetical protein
MRIELQRSFSAEKDLPKSEDWNDFVERRRGALTWRQLHEQPLTVVVGEAGIGKTIEFEIECERLAREGKPAFFVALNQLVDSESWELTLRHAYERFERWKSGDETAYFFLDAVDEARLQRHSDFAKALAVVQKALRAGLPRVRIAISSRWTDWTIEGVRAALETHLAAPMEAATSELTPAASIGRAVPASSVKPSAAPKPVKPFVVSLDALSTSEARRLADALGVLDGNAFWSAVSDGGFEFMATRPLDLRWMVDLWNDRRSLGTYRELVDRNVANRLTDVNPSYQAAGVLLSPDELRIGAEKLAAAADFAGRAYISTEPWPTARTQEVAPLSVLGEWKPNDVARLLATAVFDEATYGRVRFHHRSVREYLAACWVNRQLVSGVPFHRVLQLFTASPFGTTVLIPSRRRALCWLAAVNVEARSWLTRHFPEMLLFEGDAEAWDTVSADQAFVAYVRRLKGGLRTEWYNDASEFRRIGRRLPPGRVAGVLSDPELPPHVRRSLLPIAKHGRLSDCAEIVFGMYRSATSNARERLYALDVLKTLGSPTHRAAIKEDLLSGSLTPSSVAATALAVADWSSLNVDELATVFKAAEPEGTYGTGAFARTVKDDLLPSATQTSATLLLTAILEVIPKPEPGMRFTRYPNTEGVEGAWLIDVLPDCLERLLSLLPTTLATYPGVCLEAAERIESERHSGFTDREDFARLHNLIVKHPCLRWDIALEIAQSENIRDSGSRLTWGKRGCIVSFGESDIPELNRRANDITARPEVRHVWFTVGMRLALRCLKGRARTDALSALAAGPEGDKRATAITSEKARWMDSVRQSHEYLRYERARKLEQRASEETNRATLRRDVENIRDASHMGSICWLLHYSHERANRKALSRVDYGIVASDFGQDIADALAAGLKSVWSTGDPPNPANHLDGSIPWEAITRLAGLHTLLDEGLDIASLTEPDATRAAKLAVWQFGEPSDWFEKLARAHSAVVCAALQPWICDEAQVAHGTPPPLRRSLDLATSCPSDIRATLLAPLTSLIVGGRISCRQTLKSVVRALREDDLLTATQAANVFRAQVTASLPPSGRVSDMDCLLNWFREDTASASKWFEAHVVGLGADGRDELEAFAKAAGDCKWVKLPADSLSVVALLRVHGLLGKHLSSAKSAAKHRADAFPPPTVLLRDEIPKVFVQSRGVAAHRALVQLMESESDTNRAAWLAARVREHAELESMESAQIETEDLLAITLPFLTEPRSETQLYQQVVARLEEIRKGIEEGPFSDRGLFCKGMREKLLQRWLAARFRETQNRRFSVHREEEVDDDNRTDIQLSCPNGNVCVEVKPVDATREYSANSLTDTLRVQIVDQYLRGYNSCHGILVVFRLDSKTWQIPGAQERDSSFDALIRYLQCQADLIKGESAHVHELLVVGISCVARP